MGSIVLGVHYLYIDFPTESGRGERYEVTLCMRGCGLSWFGGYILEEWYIEVFYVDVLLCILFTSSCRELVWRDRNLC